MTDDSRYGPWLGVRVAVRRLPELMESSRMSARSGISLGLRIFCADLLTPGRRRTQRLRGSAMDWKGGHGLRHGVPEEWRAVGLNRCWALQEWRVHRRNQGFAQPLSGL